MAPLRAHYQKWVLSELSTREADAQATNGIVLATLESSRVQPGIMLTATARNSHSAVH